MLKKVTTRYEIEVEEWVNKISKYYKLDKQHVYNDLIKLGITKVLETNSLLLGKDNEIDNGKNKI